jgi:hypothetical protein
MIDRSRFGVRCHTLLRVSVLEGALPRGSYGTIRFETDNIGRHLVFVDWDNGMSLPVFPREIEVIETEVPHERR